MEASPTSINSMKLEFRPAESLPSLSWCARVQRGGVVVVRHGKGVETRPDRFVEGAWDCDFGEGEFDRAQNLAGSGGVLRDGVCVFAAPFHPLEQLHVLQGERETLVSNSLAFLLQEGDDGADPSYPNYFFDLVRMTRQGLTRQPLILRTARGRRVELYSTCRLEVDEILRLSCKAAPLGPPPGNFAEYFDQLHEAVRRIVANAADPARRFTYTPVTACSRGYDSTASSAIASRVGCRVGLTFSRSGTPKGHPILGMDKPMADDSGADALRALGMEIHEFDRLKILEVPGYPKAEFYHSHTAVTDSCLRLMEDRLRGAVFFSGRHGERYWGPTLRCRRVDFREVDDVHLSGRTYSEFRLRVGYVHLPVPYIGALHGPAIHRITRSDEMRPWRLHAGYYDRPIARRIAEEAGVPRESFGHVKFGGSDKTLRLNDESERDLADFVRELVPQDVRRRLRVGPLHERMYNHYRVQYVRAHYGHLPMVSRALDISRTDRLHLLWGSVYLYLFHWGVDKMLKRYAG